MALEIIRSLLIDPEDVRSVSATTDGMAGVIHCYDGRELTTDPASAHALIDRLAEMELAIRVK